MPKLTAVASVLANLGPGKTHDDKPLALPPGPVSLETFARLDLGLTPIQCWQIYAGVDALRRAFSTQLLIHVVLRRLNADALARTNIGSDDAMARLMQGGALVSLVTEPGFKGTGEVGRPAARSVDEAFKSALGQAVARLLRVDAVTEDRTDHELYDAYSDHVGESLETCASLFNLNTDHEKHHEWPVLNWCESNGPELLAKAHGLELNQCERALDAVLRRRVRQQGFRTVLEEEVDHIETLLIWVSGYVERRSGLASRRDTIRRTLKKAKTDWEKADNKKVNPPRIQPKVRRSLVAEHAMGALATEAMVETATLFDLRAAHDVFLTRLYLLPILAAAGFAGQVGLRRQPGEIDDPILAGGLLALAENRMVADGEQGEDEQDDISQFQELVSSVLERGGGSVDELAVLAHGYFQSRQPVTVAPPAGPPVFFLED